MAMINPRQVPPPPDSRAGMPYTRFIPREELQGFSAWQPGAFNTASAPESLLPLMDFAAGAGARHAARNDDGPQLGEDDAPAGGDHDGHDGHDDHEGETASERAARQIEALAAEHAAAQLEALHEDLAAEYERRLATETAEKVQAARHQGYQDGYRDGLVALESFKESHARQLTAQIGQLMVALDAELQAMESQLATSVARVATELARQVVRSELAIRPALVTQVAQEALMAMLQSVRTITLLVHPDDHALVAQGCAEQLASRGAKLQSSTAVARGGVRLESEAGSIDACVSARWNQATQALGTGVAWSDADAPGGDA